MKLITSPNSPFGARVAIALKAKGIEIEAVRPPAAGLRSEEFLAVNPVAKIPVLITESGTVIPESEVILDYLEARYPTPSLRPADVDDLARVKTAIRIMDNYVMAPVIRTFPHLNPAARDEAVVAAERARWIDGLAMLAHFVAEPLPRAEAGLSLADCALPTALHLSTRISAMLGYEEDPIRAHDGLLAYFQRMALDPIVGPVLADMTAAQEESDGRAGRASVASWHAELAPNLRPALQPIHN